MAKFGLLFLILIAGWISPAALTQEMRPAEDAGTAASQIEQAMDDLLDFYYIAPTTFSTKLYTYQDIMGHTQIAQLDRVALETFYQQWLWRGHQWGKIVTTQMEKISWPARRPPAADTTKLELLVKPYLDDIQRRLRRILYKLTTPENSPYVIYLKNLMAKQHLYLKIAPGTASINPVARELFLAPQDILGVPVPALINTLAHEYGHLLGLQAFLGHPNAYYFVSLAEDSSARHDSYFKQLWQTSQTAIGHQLANYPFTPALQAYAAQGITSSSLLDEGWREEFQEKYAKAYWPKFVPLLKSLLQDHSSTTTSSSIDAAAAEAFTRMMEAYYVHAAGFAREKAAGKLPVSKIEEVIADHIAKLVLETYVEELPTMEAKAKFVREALFNRFKAPTASWAIQHADRYPGLLPYDLNWDRSHLAGENDPQKIQDWNDLLQIDQAAIAQDPHPTGQDRLRIFLTSPILRQPLLATEDAQNPLLQGVPCAAQLR